jgi:hypothetical protein
VFAFVPRKSHLRNFVWCNLFSSNLKFRKSQILLPK